MQENDEKNAPKPGIVYVLTNQGMPGYVKIGRTINLPDRLSVLNAKSAVPHPFVVHYAVEVEDAKGAESLLHDAFDDYRVSPKREFFEVKPARVAAALGLTLINGRVVDENHIVANGKDDTTPDTTGMTEDEIETHEKRARRRANFQFKDLGIPVGAVLTFSRNSEVTAKVVDDKNKVEFRGERTTLSRAATIQLGGTTCVNGVYYWEYQGEILDDIRTRKEQEAEDENEYDS